MTSPNSSLAPWTGADAQSRLAELEYQYHDPSAAETVQAVQRLQEQHHQRVTSGLMLYAGSNVLSPNVLAAHDSGLSTRPAMGWPGEKLQTGVDEVEHLEVLTARQVARAFDAHHAEVRLLTGSMANLAAFIAFCQPGDPIAVLSPRAGGHLSYQSFGSGGIRNLRVHHLPYDPVRLDVNHDAIRSFFSQVRPRLVIIGGSVTLFPHDVSPIREAAAAIGAWLIYDISHTAGLIAAGDLPNPLEHGAHALTFSTYKTFAGPAGGAIVTNDAEAAEHTSHALYPMLTSNYDPARLGPLAVAAAEAVEQTPPWSRATISSAQLLGESLATKGHRLLGWERGFTRTHQIVLDTSELGSATAIVRGLEAVGIYTSTCALPAQSPQSPPRGIRVGLQELVRQGAKDEHIVALGGIFDSALTGAAPKSRLTARVTDLRADFDTDLWGR